MKLFTIGFTKKSAEEFFMRLKEAGVRRVVDVRLNNTSQIAGFAKARDLEFFLRAVAAIDYLHLPELAPTQDVLDDFVKAKGAWSEYARRFTQLMETRRVAETLHGELRHDARSPSGAQHNWKGAVSSGGRDMELTITHPAFCEKLNKGHEVSTSCLLTMSLSMPYKPPEWQKDQAPVCWKLIAGVIEL